VADVRAKWDEHLRGNDQWKYHLWAVLMLRAWSSTPYRA